MKNPSFFIHCLIITIKICPCNTICGNVCTVEQILKGTTIYAPMFPNVYSPFEGSCRMSFDGSCLKCGTIEGVVFDIPYREIHSHSFKFKL